MNKKLIIIILIILAAGAGAWYYFGKTSGSTTSTSTEGCERKTEITYTTTGFAPECIIVSSGTSVTFVNQSAKTVEVAADPHPIHTGNREISGGEFSLAIPAGESKSFVMTKKGTTAYHNHLNTSQSGRVVVE